MRRHGCEALAVPHVELSTKQIGTWWRYVSLDEPSALLVTTLYLYPGQVRSLGDRTPLEKYRWRSVIGDKLRNSVDTFLPVLLGTPLQDVARDARVARFMSGPCNQLLRASAYVVKLYYANEAVLRSAIAFGRQS